MIKLNTKHIPIVFKKKFIVDPLVLDNLSPGKMELWKYTVDRINIQGVSKTTGKERLKTSSEKINNYANKIGSPLFLDVGASDASSSLFTHNLVKNNGKDIITFAADKFIQINYFKHKVFTYYFTDDNIPFLCKILNFFSLQLNADKHKDYISKYLVKTLTRLFNNQYKKTIPEHISLLNPLINLSTNFNYIYLDAFRLKKEFINKFDIVRCSNLLQRCYFNDKEIRIALDNFLEYLKPNGLLIISWTPANSDFESGIILKKHNGSYRKIERFNKGSEIENIYEFN